MQVAYGSGGAIALLNMQAVAAIGLLVRETIFAGNQVLATSNVKVGVVVVIHTGGTGIDDALTVAEVTLPIWKIDGDSRPSTRCNENPSLGCNTMSTKGCTGRVDHSQSGGSRLGKPYMIDNKPGNPDHCPHGPVSNFSLCAVFAHASVSAIRIGAVCCARFRALI